MYYVYKTTNIVNNKIYVGVHKSDNIQSDEYIGSGKYLNSAVIKYGKDKFKRQILYQFESKEKAYLMQSQIVDKQFVKRKDTYNIKLGGEGGGDHLRGTVTVKDKSGNTFQVDRDDPRYLSGQLTGITKGCRGENWARYGQSNWIKDKIWIHNFELKQNKLISNLDCIPLGWSKGRKIFSKELSERIGGKGTIQIYNPETLQHRKISQNQKIPQGFIRGQNYQRKNTTIINLDTGQKRIIGYNEVIPQGFVKGWSKKLLKSLNKLSSLQLLRQQVILN